MPSEPKPTSPEQIQLAEYQVWDRVERRLWSRGRLILIAAVVLVLVAALLGVPLIEERIERRINERAEGLIAERLAASSVDLPALRQEIRNESFAQQQEWARSQVALERRIAALGDRTAELQNASKSLLEGTAEFEKVKNQVRQIQQVQKTEETRVRQLRERHEKELGEFREQTDAFLAQLNNATSAEFRYVEDLVNRDLDELRLIVADQVQGNPAIFSTYVNVSQRDGQITGLNFGDDRGNVFLRVRAFGARAAKPFYESESIKVQTTQWNAMRINLRIPAPALEKIQAAQRTAEEKQSDPEYRYGFVIQTAAGKMSQWSGLHVDSFVPPVSLTPKND